MTDLKTLYEVNDGKSKSFAHKLATNSEGLWVMEEKGTGKVFTADKATVEEVMPYTISIQFPTSDSHYSYFAEKGKFKKGDFFIIGRANSGFAIVRVTDVDTKSKKATKDFTPMAKLNIDKLD